MFLLLVEVCPLLYTTRLSTARMLIELEEWEKAVNVLDGLVEEDDEIVDPWYLLGKALECLPEPGTSGLEKTAPPGGLEFFFTSN